jgi:hypothetical protein
MKSWDLGIQFNSIFYVLDLFAVITNLTYSFTLKVPKLALFVKIKADVTASNHIFPSLQTHVRVRLYKISLLIILESVSQL